VHPNQIAKWKKQTLENMAAFFTDGRSKTNKREDDRLKERLFQQIGQLQFELGWLKNSWRSKSAPTTPTKGRLEQYPADAPVRERGAKHRF
jgi:hypothetical protein